MIVNKYNEEGLKPPSGNFVEKILFETITNSFVGVLYSLTRVVVPLDELISLNAKYIAFERNDERHLYGCAFERVRK